MMQSKAQGFVDAKSEVINIKLSALPKINLLTVEESFVIRGKKLFFLLFF